MGAPQQPESASSADFSMAVDVALCCLRREPVPDGAMDTGEQVIALVAGFVNLTLSLAAQATGTVEVQALERLLAELRDAGVDVNLVPAGGA